ncbi:S24 family peptidase [uncultured Roseibium sp.]|uniref:LexA family protein n=1 Tax=uncultured Roseibium sp. TaxID=1936171 RepID=UPI0032179A3B
MDADTDIPARLTALKDQSGFSLREIARRMGYRNASSIQRYFSTDFVKPSLPADFVAKLLPVLEGQGDPPITREQILDLAPTLVTEFDIAPSGSRPKALEIKGEVAAGLWMEAGLFETEQSEESTLAGGDRRFPPNAQYLLRIRGESMNRIARDGDLILCLDFMQAGIELKSGDVAVVERSRDGGHTIERTAKRVVRHNDRIELRPESNDPRFQDPIIFNDHSEEAAEVRIIAKVLSVIRPVE